MGLGEPRAWALGEPLLRRESDADGEGSKAEVSPIGRRCLCVLTAGLFALYLVLGAIERVSFARMATSMPQGVLLMHTLLTVMSLMLFTVLQLARSQSSGPPISAALQQLNLPDVLFIAVLDVLHSLLALMGATVIPGVVQAMLLQATVPAIALFASIFPLRPASAEAIGQGSTTTAKSGAAALLQQCLHLVNHNSPVQCALIVLRSPQMYQALGALLVAYAVGATVVTSPQVAEGEDIFIGPQLRHASMQAAERQLVPGEVSPWHGWDGSVPVEDKGEDETSGGVSLAADGRLLFVLSTIVAALATTHKQRCLARRPVDILVFNTSLAALQVRPRDAPWSTRARLSQHLSTGGAPMTVRAVCPD